jgi:protease I
MKKIAILIENMFEEVELLYPYYRLEEAGYEVHLVGKEKNKVYKGKTSSHPFKSTHASKDINADDYEAVIIPGGYSPDYMRRTEETVDFVSNMFKQKKLIAAICHGPWMIVSGCDIKGKKVTSFYSIKDDLRNAGANWVDEEVVVDENLITSQNPSTMTKWLKAILEYMD